jgi:hypothetical protein
MEFRENACNIVKIWKLDPSFFVSTALTAIFVQSISTIWSNSKDRQCNGLKKNSKRTNNYVQNITQKTEDWATRVSLQTGYELMSSGRIRSSISTSGTRRFTLVANPVTSHEWVKERNVITTKGPYRWLFVIQILCIATHVFKTMTPPNLQSDS